ncbi:MAG: guanylate kinase [Eubacteriales bacterium]|nr:guanylate kinase [Eubacteriales bacterium]
MDRNGSLIVLSGFSGVGKGTVSKEIVKKYGYHLSVSATTRGPRPGEEHGREYFFLSKEEFLDSVAQNGFIEYAQYVNNYYGTPRKFVEEKLESGQGVILEIEVQGALAIKEQYPDAILIFLTAPTAADLKERLIGRGSETMDVINDRLKRAVEEAEFIDHYDYIVCNETGKIEKCMEDIHNIIETENTKVRKQQNFIAGLKEELKTYEQ